MKRERQCIDSLLEAPAKETSPLLEVVTDANLAPVRASGNIQDAEFLRPRKLSKAEKLEKKQKKKDKNFRCDFFFSLDAHFID